jgi:hypothetical protein
MQCVQKYPEFFPSSWSSEGKEEVETNSSEKAQVEIEENDK